MKCPLFDRKEQGGSNCCHCTNWREVRCTKHEDLKRLTVGVEDGRKSNRGTIQTE